MPTTRLHKRQKTHVVVVKRSHYLLEELLVMVREQTSKRNAAQNEAFQAAFGREDNVADTRTLARQSVFHDFMTKTLTERTSNSAD
jgi:hypothetical protein